MNGDKDLGEATLEGEVVTQFESLDWHVERISSSWRQSVEGIFETGRRVQAALDQLPHGEKSKLWERLPFQKSTGYALAKVANDTRIFHYSGNLPPDWRSVYELTQLDDDQLPRYIESGEPIEQKRIRAWRRAISGTRGDHSADEAIITATDPDVRSGDFREVLSDVEAGSVNLILTDPPYPKKFISLWSDLGAFAAEKLADDGILIAYSGKYLLPEVLARLSEHLNYWWVSALFHEGNGHSTPLGNPVRKVISQWRPMVMFVKSGYPNVFRDVVPAGGKEKTSHNWGQSVAESVWLIEQYTQLGQLVLDPMAGGGSVAKACRETGRNFIGAEINAATP